MRFKIFAVVISLCLAGCSALPGLQNMDNLPVPQENSPPEFQVKPQLIPITAWSLTKNPPPAFKYRLAAQDVLSISVWKHPELSMPEQTNTANTLSNQATGAPGYLIHENGCIYFPLLGNVKLAGKTVQQAQQLLQKRLQYYVRDPHVLMRVADFRSQRVFMMGEVLKPGFLPLNDQPLSVTAAINLAGSLDPNAADPRHIYIIRGSILKPQIYWLNASSPMALLLGERFPLKNNDIVIVSTATVTRWNRFLNQLLPTLQSVWYTKAITGK